MRTIVASFGRTKVPGEVLQDNAGQIGGSISDQPQKFWINEVWQVEEIPSQLPEGEKCST